MTAKKTPARKVPARKPAAKVPAKADQTEPNRPTNEIGSTFIFTSGDTTVTLPFVEHIPMGVLEDAVEGAKNVGHAIDHIIAELTATTDQTDARRALPLSEYGRLITEWDEASASKLGELFG